MKKTIRLTESDLHDIIKESVNKILNEGQGWDFFKKRTKEIWDGDYDDTIKDYQNEKNTEEYKKDKKNFINKGSAYSDNDNYYHTDEPTRTLQDKFGKYNKPINKGVTGKVGRALGVAGVNAAMGARHAYNKMRGAYK